MSLSKKDYNKLYRLQDKFLHWWKTLGKPFYLTGGTALGRFYLNHRYSDDLDFFVNRDKNYADYISEINVKIKERFNYDPSQSLFSEDFTRIFINEEGVSLKIEFVNDVSARLDKPVSYLFGLIDTPLNILANKLTTIVGRDEPKDIFDIIQIATNYSFRWSDVFVVAKQKAVINEIDVEQQLISFPVEWMKSVRWMKEPYDDEKYRSLLNRIADDFLLGKENTLGIGKINIKKAKPLMEKSTNITD